MFLLPIFIDKKHFIGIYFDKSRLTSEIEKQFPFENDRSEPSLYIKSTLSDFCQQRVLWNAKTSQ